MHRNTLAALVFLVASASSSLALAQASCPSADRLQFIDMTNSSNVIDASDFASASHTISMGATPYIYTYIDVAIIRNNSTGYCSAYFLSYDGVNAVPWLTKNSNLCMGPYADFHDNAEVHGLPQCNGSEIDLEPMIYNGYRLHTYLGGGHDHADGSFGVDRIYGGAGDDNMGDQSGTGDRMYGETNNDALYCSDGSSTICDGGGAPDYIEDYLGSNDSVYGGGSTDQIYVCGVKEVDCGESAPGYSDSDNLFYNPYQGNDVNCENVYPNSRCP